MLSFHLHSYECFHKYLIFCSFICSFVLSWTFTDRCKLPSNWGCKKINVKWVEIDHLSWLESKTDENEILNLTFPPLPSLHGERGTSYKAHPLSSRDLEGAALTDEDGLHALRWKPPCSVQTKQSSESFSHGEQLQQPGSWTPRQRAALRLASDGSTASRQRKAQAFSGCLSVQLHTSRKLIQKGKGPPKSTTNIPVSSCNQK